MDRPMPHADVERGVSTVRAFRGMKDTKYKITASYLRQELEVIDAAETLEEALSLMEEYQMAYGGDWEVNVAINACQL